MWNFKDAQIFFFRKTKNSDLKHLHLFKTFFPQEKKKMQVPTPPPKRSPELSSFNLLMSQNTK